MTRARAMLPIAALFALAIGATFTLDRGPELTCDVWAIEPGNAVPEECLDGHQLLLAA